MCSNVGERGTAEKGDIRGIEGGERVGGNTLAQAQSGTTKILRRDK